MAKVHWDGFWANTEYTDIDCPTQFALFCKDWLDDRIGGNFNGSVMEFGCGHGRDSNFFCEEGCSVYAYDLSDSAILVAREKFGKKGLKFYCRDLADEAEKSRGFKMCNVTYARWYLHCIPAGKAELAFATLFFCTKPGGYIMLEYKTPRTDGESIYNTEHMRVPINAQGLLAHGMNLGLEVVFHREGYNMSRMKDHNPYLARTIFRRPE